LKAYVLSGISPELDNGQTKAISGNFTHYGCCTREDLEAAKSNLREWFTVTGITERYDESLLLMHKRLGWNFGPYYVRANVTRSRPRKTGVSPDTIEAIREVNSLDVELYEFAIQMHEE